MSNLNKFILLILAVELFLLYLQKTSAFFSDSAHSSNNDFIASTEFPSPTPTITPTITPTLTPTVTPTPTVSAGDLVINEVFESGDNNSEWVELYNPSSQEISISSWKIGDADSLDTLPSLSPIPAGSYVVITANDAITVPSSAIKINLDSYLGSGFNASGDLVVLKDANNNLVDQMSYGNNSDAFPSPPSAPGTDQSLVRIPNGSDTDTTADWQLDSTPTIGEVNNL